MIMQNREIYLLTKQWAGGLSEVIGAYWNKETAKRVAAENITGGSPYILMTTAILHGDMIDLD